ncbi:TPA: 50S ribosomal protein L32 [Candidatus Poribacteria bacterium]|jgi:large subunit ribosomal protein L32|nr:50S ribosomal protein L32 [Candidatus Poribacteria bacterium]HIA69617.1 50S ribosomal protein L32 [Candidatus Poribacteria bacterium]HIB98181.1 50S ribosomal protein L32 [Candidatus Poribacteria bacterium]HIN27723.1 50S ribosomal protein L32 [Candidatus Poribacteria bacterium]HIO08278.1 50S ribosomal protein L32 [Candidatus Poribacteria bacterium]
MAHPKRRKSYSKKMMGRSHHALKQKPFAECTNCGEIARPHHVCQSCGYYNGRQILEIRTDEVSE